MNKRYQYRSMQIVLILTLNKSGKYNPFLSFILLRSNVIYTFIDEGFHKNKFSKKV